MDAAPGGRQLMPWADEPRLEKVGLLVPRLFVAAIHAKIRAP